MVFGREYDGWEAMNKVKSPSSDRKKESVRSERGKKWLKEILCILKFIPNVNIASNCVK